MITVDSRLDRMLSLLESREHEMKKKATNGFILKEMMVNTILAGTVGYFLAKILDYHLNPD